MNEGIINLFGATHISSGVEVPKGSPEMKVDDVDESNVAQDDTQDMPDASAYHEIMTEEFEANDTRIAMIGNVDSGKSTLIGVLTNATLDDGRGAARGLVLKHRHEQENGRTSAVTVEIMGYKGKQLILYYCGTFYVVSEKNVHVFSIIAEDPVVACILYFFCSDENILMF
jgi:hypothetical protein